MILDPGRHKPSRRHCGPGLDLAAPGLRRVSCGLLVASSRDRQQSQSSGEKEDTWRWRWRCSQHARFTLFLLRKRFFFGRHPTGTEALWRCPSSPAITSTSAAAADACASAEPSSRMQIYRRARTTRRTADRLPSLLLSKTRLPRDEFN